MSNQITLRKAFHTWIPPMVTRGNNFLTCIITWSWTSSRLILKTEVICVGFYWDNYWNKNGKYSLHILMFVFAKHHTNRCLSRLQLQSEVIHDAKVVLWFDLWVKWVAMACNYSAFLWLWESSIFSIILYTFNKWWDYALKKNDMSLRTSEHKTTVEWYLLSSRLSCLWTVTWPLSLEQNVIYSLVNT